MRLRPVARADLDAIRHLRNTNREWFFHDREISAAEHVAWFESLPSRPVDFFVIEEDGRVVGTISLTRRDRQVEVGNLVLDPSSRGRGLMRQAVTLLTAQPGDYVADVKAGNDRSLRVFRAAGFSETESGGVVHFTRRVTG
jgi:RimJ/RimL family protein N-acetyltransferase